MITMGAMSDREVLTAIDAGLLVEAFPKTLRSHVARAADVEIRHLHERQWTDRFQVIVSGDVVLIPYRLHFSAGLLGEGATPTDHLIRQCFQARSNDGFQRQRAVRHLLVDVQPWSAPFILALVGEYVIEILNDIHDALMPRVPAALADFICANPAYWELTQQRVASYWNVYYRADFRRSDYVGFKLLNTLAEAVRLRAVAV